MLHRNAVALSVVLAAGAVACGQADPLPIVYLDAGQVPVYFEDAAVDAGGNPPGPDGGVPEENVLVSGTVTKLETYLEGNPTTVSDARLTAYGVTGVAPTMTLPNGQYAIRIPKDGYALLRATKDTYYPTSEVLEVRNYDVPNKNLFIASITYVDSIATTYGVDIYTPFACHAPNNPADQCRYAIILGRIVDDGTEGAGVPTPVAGVAKEEFKVVALGREDWYKKGPYFLGSTGTPNTTYLQSQRALDPATNRYRGGLYVTFVEIPAVGYAERDFTITIASTAGGTVNRYFGPTNVKVARETLAWANVAETGQGMPPPPPPPPEDIDFDTQIYPLFLQLAQGGLGCQGCHTDQYGAPSGGMNLYGGPEIAYASLNPANYPARVNVANPAASYLLKRPLYETNGLQDHPIYAFTDEQDPNYRTVYAWIQEGGQRLVNTPPPVSFYTQIRPMLYKPPAEGGIGCYACHVNGVDALTAPGGFYMGGNGNDLYAELTQEAPTDPGQYAEQYRINKNAQYVGRSLILTKPLVGSAEVHDVKIFYGADDPRYQLIYTWIQQGYQNDTP